MIVRQAGPIALVLALAVWPFDAGSGDGDPCFAQVPVNKLRLEKSASGIVLSWEAPSSVAWYEILRCEGQPAICEFVSLAPVTQTSYEDVEVPGAAYVGYRVAAIVDPDDNGCGVDTFCTLPFSQCGGVGVCLLHSELCDPLPFDPVCGCDGSTYYNLCFASAYGENIRYLGACGP
jgi:hypothetical protein